MSVRRDITGIILAGGKSQRMGVDKALLTLDGEALLVRIARTMRSLFEQVYIISANNRYRFLHLPMFDDFFRGCGPLAGIHSGLLHSKTRRSFIAACDTPFVSLDLIEYIVEFESQADVKVPATNGILHPLCGLYSRRCIPRLEWSLRSGLRRVQDVLERLDVDVVPIGPWLPFYREDLLLNINEPSEYQSLAGIHGVPTTSRQ
jgi:molybdopterin-guanine dinucleotide biosynthesis protein A